VAGAVVQVKTKAQNTTATPATITFDTAATAGNTIVAIYGGDDYVTSGNKPSGYTEPTGARQETFLGHYVWYKTAAGGETTINATPNAAAFYTMIALELSGVGTLDVSNGTLIQSAATTMTTPTVTPTAGARFAVGTIGGSSTAGSTSMGAWTSSFIEAADVATTLASGTRDNIGAATLSFTADGVTGISTGVTWDAGASPQSRTGIILVFQESAAVVRNPRPIRMISQAMNRAANY
jgi:adhesin HecA-like repeat protein